MAVRALPFCSSGQARAAVSASGAGLDDRDEAGAGQTVGIPWRGQTGGELGLAAEDQTVRQGFEPVGGQGGARRGGMSTIISAMPAAGAPSVAPAELHQPIVGQAMAGEEGAGQRAYFVATRRRRRCGQGQRATSSRSAMVSTSIQLLGAATTRSARPKPNAVSSRTRSPTASSSHEKILTSDAKVDVAGDQGGGDAGRRSQADLDVVHALDPRQVAALALGAQPKPQSASHASTCSLSLPLEGTAITRGVLMRRPRPGAAGPDHASHRAARHGVAQPGRQAIVPAPAANRLIWAEAGAADLEEHAVVVAERPAEGGGEHGRNRGNARPSEGLQAAIPCRSPPPGGRGARSEMERSAARGRSLMARNRTMVSAWARVRCGRAAIAACSRRRWTISRAERPPTGSISETRQISCSAAAASSSETCPRRAARRSAPLGAGRASA